MDVSPLPYAVRSRLVFHGAVLFLLGLVAGLIFTFEAIGHVAVWPVIPQLAIDFPGDEAGWRKVHLGFIVNSMAILLFAAASGHASLGPRAGKIFMGSVITTGWGNSLGFLIGALFGVRGLEFVGNEANQVSYLLFTIAAVTAFTQAGLLAVGALRAGRS